MLRIWLPVIILGALYVLGSLGQAVIYRRQGKRPALIVKATGLLGAIAMVWFIVQAILSTVV